jgi:hypothetical protein
MGQWTHGGGFSVDASVRIEPADRTGCERLLRYCARPPFALQRLRPLDPERFVHDHAQPGPGGRGALLLTPLVCPLCGARMQIIAFIIDAATRRDILVASVSRRHHPASQPRSRLRRRRWPPPGTPTTRLTSSRLTTNSACR